jgi:hypothetical protein
MAVASISTFEILSAALVDNAFVAGGSTATPTIAPEEILRFLARLRLLEGVPFNNLVPDSELLPNESIRFFFLDRAWTDALVQGALSVGTANTIERAQLEKLYPQVEKEIDDAERRYRSPGGEPLLGGTAGLVTGFLMRSAVVAGWPGLHVRAYRTEPADNDEEIVAESDPSRIKLLRLERLAPAVLLALFDGVPSVLHIEEPRQGVQYGVRLEEGSGGQWKSFVPARNVQTAGYVNAAGNPVDTSLQAAEITVAFRSGAAGVIDMTNTARNFAAAAGTGMSSGPTDPIDGAEFALQMIRFPYRQVFAQSETSPGIQNDAFRPTALTVSQGYARLLDLKIAEG